VSPSATVVTCQPKVMLLPQHSVTSENTGLPFTVDSRLGPGLTICKVRTIVTHSMSAAVDKAVERLLQTTHSMHQCIDCSMLVQCIHADQDPYIQPGLQSIYTFAGGFHGLTVHPGVHSGATGKGLANGKLNGKPAGKPACNAKECPGFSWCVPAKLLLYMLLPGA
jgi:hypothetical protein